MYQQADNDHIAFPGLPASAWTFGHVLCAEFWDWETPTPEMWPELAQKISDQFNFSSKRGSAFGGVRLNASTTGAKSSGGWERVRNKAKAIFASQHPYNWINLCSGYDYIVGENANEGFVSFWMNSDSTASTSRFSIVIGSDLSANLEFFIGDLAILFDNSFKPKWGAAYLFPKAAGGNSYMQDSAFGGSEISTLGDINVTKQHSFRMARALVRSSSDFKYAEGYFREIHEVNFLSEAHLNAKLSGGTVREYAQRVGILTPSEIGELLWKWTLNVEELRLARMDLEQSGLVLSAPCEPVASS